MELIEGALYFIVSYADQRLLYPMVDCVVYLGTNIDPDDDDDYWYFQEAASVATSGKYPNCDDEEGFVLRLTEEQTQRALTVDELRAELSECIKRRRT